MAILTVGPTSTYPSIAAAMAFASFGDVISLEAGYSNENATVTVNGLSFDGGLTSTNITLQLATGMSAITLLGTAPINVLDGADANSVVGNDGDNTITVSSGVDVVTAGNGTDRLIIDYSAATAPITGTTVSVTDGGTHAVTFTGVEDFSITTGSGNDTVTVADGANVVTTGLGDDTITVGNGSNVVNGGGNNDTITVGSGVNTVNGGDGNDTIIVGNGGNNVDGGDGDDGITSGSGNDVIIAGLGNDTVLTNAGADVATVNGGIDTVDMGSQTDRLIVDFSSSVTAVTGGVTGGTLVGGYDGSFADVAGTSSVVFQGTENLTVTTGLVNDVISTGDGDDVLDGGAGTDQLNAGGGTDTLLIGLGSDALDGGAGTDNVVFSAARTNYQVTDLGGGVFQSVDLRSGSPDGTDTLVNMEGFVFTDGTFDAVTVLNDPPVLGGDNAATVVAGQSVIVTTADLTATDTDSTNGQLVYSVTGTLHGTVLLNGVSATNFTQADLVANTVSFQHDGSSINGSFSVSLTDGASSAQAATVAVAVTIPPATPVLGGDNGVTVASGQTVIITSADLTATDTDNSNVELVYTVTSALHGALRVSGVSAATFTQADLLANLVSFQHDGSGSDGSFSVSLTDGVSAPQTATIAATLTVPPVGTPVLGGDGQVAVTSGQTVAITSADLTATDSNSSNAQLVYSVISALHGTLLVNGVAAASFTQADVLANIVSFQHDGSTTNGSFSVSLTDGTSTPQLASVTAVLPSTIRTVGPTGDHPTLTDAIAASNPGDTIIMQPGYSNDSAIVTKPDLTIGGDASSTGIELHLALGVTRLTLTGEAPINVFDAADNNIIIGNDGDNVITVTNGIDGVDGGLGNDRLVVDYHLATGPVLGTASIGFTEVGGTRHVSIVDGTFESFTILTGTGADRVVAANGDDLIVSGGGDDALYGEGGNDEIVGNAGKDTLAGGSGQDLLRGGRGDDTYVLEDGADTIVEVKGIDTITSTISRALFNYTAIENLTLVGAANASGIGNQEDNQLTGNAGANLLKGKAGDDYLDGRGGADHLIGGSGDDVFDFNKVAQIGTLAGQRDVIMDFTQGDDIINLRSIDASTARGGQAFQFVAEEDSTFSGVKGELIWDMRDKAGTANDKTLVMGDINGDKIVDFRIEITGLHTLLASDFIL